MTGNEQFERFCCERLHAAHLDTSTGDPSVMLFDLSVSSFRQHVDWASDLQNRDQRPFQLRAGFVEDVRPNAIADYWEGTHFVGMHSPLFVVIMEFAMFCFTQRGFFPSIGDAGAERSPPLIGCYVPGFWLLDRTKQGKPVDHAHSEALTPRDPERYRASLYLALLMARFVWLHEFSHCHNGHVGFAQEKGLALRLNEVPMPAVGFAKLTFAGSAEDKRDILHCLEFDADMSAFFASCRLQADDRENIEGLGAWDRRMRLVMTIFGAYAMTWLFDELQTYMAPESRMTPQQNASHPPPYYRLQNLFRTVASQLKGKVENASELNTSACIQFDAINRTIDTAYRSKSLFRDLRDEALQGEITKLDERLSDLKPDLAAFEYS